MGVWQTIDTAPTDETESYLVLVPGNDVCDSLVLQVANFEGQRYPDHKDFLIDWNDRVVNATHWMPLPGVPSRTNAGCTCQACGALFTGDLIVPDDVWERIKPDGSAVGAGLLCPSCIMGRIRDRGIWTAARAIDIDNRMHKHRKKEPLPGTEAE